MPTYILQCPACNIRSERFARSHEREAMKCDQCGGVLDTHPDQFKSAAIGTQFKRAARESRTLAFQESGIEDVKRDCPSMDFKVRDGEAIPVFHDDKHHRKVMGEMKRAGDRYKAESKAAKEARKPKVSIRDKSKKVQEWRSKLASRR